MNTKETILAAEHMDWMQVVLNGGPPCFHIEDGRFCGRAERWAGHDNDLHRDHPFVSLADLLRHFVSLADLLNGIDRETADPAVKRRIQSAIAKRLDVTCPKCGHTDPEAQWKAAVRQGTHQGQHVVDMGFHCACGNEFGFEIFHEPTPPN